MQDKTLNLITRKHLMSLISVKSEKTIAKWEKAGMPHIKIGRLVRYDLIEVLNWLPQGDMEDVK